MSKLIIEGKNKLSGEIKVNGAKNAALKIIPAALLSEEKITINNLPGIEDVDRTLELVRELGGSINLIDNGCEIEIKNIAKNELPLKIASKLRASIMFVGPLLAKLGEVIFPSPGGCNLASGAKRPIDLFISGFKKFGAEINKKNDSYHIKAKKLKGCKYFFTTATVTGTESMILTAILADGTTTLKNCAMEPEIKALSDYLNSQGAKIKGAGTPTIIIKGVKKINAGEFNIIPDRIETGTFAIMAAAAKSELTITDCDPKHIEILLNIFNKINIQFKVGKNYLVIKPADKIYPCNVKTHEYPGFPTDLQAPFTVLMTQAAGSSIIHETIYDRRLLYSDMLMQMGADIIMCDPHRIVVNGPTQLYGKQLTSPDLRAGIAMLIAGLIADGQTAIDNIYQIDRGYQNIDDRLRAVGAKIRRINTLKL
ncbi:MAG: UDP-N-acetylglucosamine 1-carboxyvinyltransferase [Patescibacteria group bacterium]|nr:UDP-N-acetylglucosamine 1-carboxyvinyltransferase [Patescibacteria group bacterium]